MPDNSQDNTTPAIPYDKEVEIVMRLGTRCAIVSAFLYGRLTDFEIYDYEGPGSPNRAILGTDAEE